MRKCVSCHMHSHSLVSKYHVSYKVTHRFLCLISGHGKSDDDDNNDIMLIFLLIMMGRERIKKNV